MSLFSALLPPVDVRASLRFALGVPRDVGERGGEDGAGDAAPRWTPESRWHVTLGFYGDDGPPGSPGDPARRLGLLREALAGRPPVTLRIEGAGTFPGVLWAAVHGGGLAGLAAAAGADLERRAYRPHLTLARWPREQNPPPAVARVLTAGCRTRSWTAREVVLLRGERIDGGTRYVPAGTVPLDGGARGGDGGGDTPSAPTGTAVHPERS
ncbi:RNA 2',3'-cyclic phosphodiesterase [Amycolatopsis antarctica]|uniref:RNA 2',3'-cyclic phosphodiesterase n=1 Tax=Amycolatopsis antarctica TaxID=1854586 RepID=A0A263D7A2_9PSEU|nr:2'-5' RNA ligase family protein [Amycolatopsis antarctica]OZM74392.1 RNA 2',3'-cyclic phosphodiesterase [Amycolatopsis antarctica]